MNKYRVILIEDSKLQERNIYEVKAFSEDDAIDLAINGEGILINSDIIYSDIINSELEECNLIQKLA